MNVTWEQTDGNAVARLAGRIDSSNAAQLQRDLEAGLNDDVKAVVLDFEEVSFISSAGLRIVLLIGRELKQRQAKYAVCSLSESIRDLFEISGFDQIVPIHGSPARAIDTFAAPPETAKPGIDSLPGVIDFDIVANNLKEIAAMTIDKYEHLNDTTLSDETRERALQAIDDALWNRVEELKRQRRTVLKDMFREASSTLNAVGGAKSQARRGSGGRLNQLQRQTVAALV